MTIVQRSHDDAGPTFLSTHKTRGTPTAPLAAQPNDFIGEIRFGYMLPERPSSKFAYGATIDAFAGYGPSSWNGYGGYLRFRTLPPGSNIPLTGFVIQQSGVDATHYISIWNAKAPGDLIVSAAGQAGDMGINLVTSGAGTVKINGVDVMAEIEALKARLAASGR